MFGFRHNHSLRSWRKILVAAIATTLAAFLNCGCAPNPNLADAQPVNTPPRIHPDYTGLIIPPNIAPLNFAIQEPGTAFYAVLRGSRGTPIEIRSRGPTIAIPGKAWHTLLRANRGGELYFDLYARTKDHRWNRFAAITNRVAEEDVDAYLVYRKIHPSHNSWSSMGLYQRDLSSYAERPILENRRFENDCCHCHSFAQDGPRRCAVDIRSQKYGNSLLLIQDGAVRALAGPVGFTAWHPNGRLLACSFSKPQLLLHSQKNDMRDIVEFESWIGYLSADSNVVRRIPGLADETRLQTCPTWSPDGRYLYFCGAPRLFGGFAEMLQSDFTQVKYDLLRVAYDPERDQWGEVETILPAQATGLSAAQLRISPDGRWLTFCLCAYGCWPTYHPESDLYMIDLKAGRETGQFQHKKMELNSDECESWHGWSANSRWIVFSSKRGNPLFNRPYLAYVDQQGKCGKPFIVPQKDPGFYDACLKTYTIPVLAAKPVSVAEKTLVRAIIAPKKTPLVMPAPAEAKK